MLYKYCQKGKGDAMKPVLNFAAVAAFTLLPAIAILSGDGALADVSKSSSTDMIEPAAVALLDKSIAAYGRPGGLFLKVQSTETDGAKTIDSSASLQWKAPNLFRIRKISNQNSALIISDGNEMFMPVAARKFRRVPVYGASLATAPFMVESIGTGLAYFLPDLLSGKNGLVAESDHAGYSGFRRYARALPITLIEGHRCYGLRQTTFYLSDGKEGLVEATAWFDASNYLLRRVHLIRRDGSERSIITDTITETKLDPEFSPNTFVWSAPPGMTEQKEKEEAETEEAETETYFDSRLVKGARPFALTGKDMTGKTVSLANYKGKVLLIDFWASWCGPCVAEMPTVLSNYKKYHGQGFEIIGISLDEDKAALTNFVKEYKMPWRQVFDGKAWQTPNAVRYDVKAIPFTLLIGRDGKIAAVNPRGEELEPAIKAALAKR
jgi:thiol-disulfide isomerase/thioredoxin/outer membrane lipoprotein-sorting protein